MRAVLLDVGGVLVVPQPAALSRVLVRSGATLERDALVRAHYRAIADADSLDGLDWVRYNARLLELSGIAEADRKRCAADMAEMVRTTADLWSHPLPDVAYGLPSLAERYRVGIVSNSDGSVRRLLAQLAMCQLGPGPATEVEVIIDSAVVGVSKPDPRIFHLALAEMGIPAAEVGYVGDTLAYDMAGAVAAGLQPIHLDPYGFCRHDDHRHITGISEL